MRSPKVWLLFLIVLGASGVVEAQVNQGSLVSALSQGMTSTNYYFARPNDLTIIVNVVGFVQRPGRYEIATSIDLVNLLSLAGGPTADGTLSKVTVTRIVSGEGKLQTRQVHLDLEDFNGVRADDLALAPGDMVNVGRTSWSVFRDAFGVVVSAAVIISAAAQVMYVQRVSK